MIVVVAQLLRSAERGPDPLEIARRAAESGRPVEVVGALPPNEAGDQRLVEIAVGGVGHAAVLRSFAAELDAADLALALRYLPEIGAIVLVDIRPGLLAAAAEAASWSGAGLVIVMPSASGAADLAGASPDAIVIGAPAHDPDGAFAGLVARLASRIDAGEKPEAALKAAARELAVDSVSVERRS